MTNVLIVCLLVTTIFAITGINFFKGRFYTCEFMAPADLYSNISLVHTKWDCINFGGYWQKIQSNFDNVIVAILTLFEMMTTEGWLLVLYNGIDATSVD
jgi:hypothetical protein